ncbi:MAG: helix-turn-helix domain-containing protein [Clostridia bacterium]
MGKSEDENRRIEISQNLGKNLLKIRKEKGFTREELAEKSNLSANYIYGLENGTYLPGCIALIDLSNALNITTSQLLDKYLDNNRNNLIDKISQEISKLSDRDLNLIITILDFYNKNSQ